ncbi:MAG: spondin domain-containing protein [Chryseolinea sp.]
MMHLIKRNFWYLSLLLPLVAACDDDNGTKDAPTQTSTITIENVLDSKPLSQTGTFQGDGTPPVILPGKSITIHFSAAKGEALSFATMYGWSNDLFFAPENPGIAVYDAGGMPIEGDVSAQIKLWDNGTRLNQAPGATVTHPGSADVKNITEVVGQDAQGNTYLPVSSLMKATLDYNGNSTFDLTIENISGGTANETPFSPGVWTVSYIVGGVLTDAMPLYTKDQPTANGLTGIAELGDNAALSTYANSMKGIFTPLSPILVVVYNGIENPIFKVGENDRGEGLTEIAQKGNADVLAGYLRGAAGVKEVYVLPAPTTKVLLPKINGQAGGMVSQAFTYSTGDRIAIATMYGFSNDWFFTNVENGVDAAIKGDISKSIALYNDGTAIDQFPGAGITQFNLAGTPLSESKVIEVVPNPNPFTTLPTIENFISVKIQ